MREDGLIWLSLAFVCSTKIQLLPVPEINTIQLLLLFVAAYNEPSISDIIFKLLKFFFKYVGDNLEINASSSSFTIVFPVSAPLKATPSDSMQSLFKFRLSSK